MPRKRSYKRYLELNATEEDVKIPERTLYRWKKKRVIQNSSKDNSETIMSDEEQNESISDNSVSSCALVESTSVLDWKANDDYSFSESITDVESHESSISCDDDIASFTASDDDDESWCSGRFSTILSSSMSDSIEVEENEASESSFQSSEAETATEILRDMNEVVGNGFTSRELLLMSLSFAFRHNLSFSALEDLLYMLSLILKTEKLPVSRYLFKKLFDHNKKMKCHYICPLCGDVAKTVIFGMHEGLDKTYKCVACLQDVNIRECNLFINLPIEDQLRNLLSDTNIADYIINRKGEEMDKIFDITDGAIYTEMKNTFSFLTHDITLTVNTDGVPVFKSSSSSIWPILFSVNELPPAVREREIMLAGVWFGKVEPYMKTFLKPFITEILKLQEGFQWQNKGNNFNSRVFLLCCCVDSVARAKVLQMKQFNGYYGCPWCYHPGVLQRTDTNPNGSICYPLSNGEYKERSNDEVRKDMIKAEYDNSTILGIKGSSILSLLPYFQLNRNVVPDYMHCVLLGVVRKLADLWFSSSNSQRGFYIGKGTNMEIINKRIISIQVPRKVRRTPRKLSERKFWKASEWKYFLLHYSVPILKDFLPADYMEHYCLLVKAIYSLLLNNIHRNILKDAKLNLFNFVEKYEHLYGIENMTFNVHQLLHLCRSVEDMGPLWAHSAFPFENYNGILLRDIHCAKGVVKQIVTRHKLRNAIPKLSENVTADNVKNFVLKMECFPFSRTNVYSHGEYHLFSKVDGAQAHCNVINSDFQENFQEAYSKMIFRGEVFVAGEMEKRNKRNDSFIVTNSNKIFEIKKIYRCGNDIKFGGNFWEIHSNVLDIPHLKVVSRANEFELMSVEEFTGKCFVFNCNGVYYVSCLPNNCENE